MSRNFKKGNIEITFLTILIFAFIVILMVVYVIYVQINTMVYPIKQDLFYIVQNAYLSMNKDELAYYVYNVDNNLLKEKVEEIIKFNYPNKDICVKNIYYDTNNNEVNIKLEYKLKPLLLEDLIGDIDLTLNEKVKLKMMEVR